MNPSLRILITEDNSMIRESLKMALEMDGYTVLEASDGLQALAVLESQPLPDLILLDLLMPNMNGYDFLAIVKKGADQPIANIPIIVISAVANLAEGKKLPVQAILTKPILLDVLLSKIQELFPRD